MMSGVFQKSFIARFFKNVRAAQLENYFSKILERLASDLIFLLSLVKKG
jgi:hypothetical protein